MKIHMRPKANVDDENDKNDHFDGNIYTAVNINEQKQQLQPHQHSNTIITKIHEMVVKFGIDYEGRGIDWNGIKWISKAQIMLAVVRKL